MNGTLKIDATTTNKVTLAAGKKQTFVVTLENLNSIEGKFIPYYSGTIPDGVTFGYLEETGVDLPIETTFSKNGKKTYSIYLENNSNSSVTITLGVQGGLSNQPLSLPSNGKMIPKTKKANKNISNVWKYDETTGSSTFCVTGLESTCQEIGPQDTYTLGTIIKYKVNEIEEKYFHVVSDNGDTLTLQQRENTLDNVAWNSVATNNTVGPSTALDELENATSLWTNVLDQTYTLGITVFKENAFTGCTAPKVNYCDKNIYTLEERTGKARMITLQEVVTTGCEIGYHSCPIWMYNYLNNSTDNNGTVNGTSYSYWTMSVNSSSAGSEYAWVITASFARAYHSPCATMRNAVRAIVMIDK